LEKNRENSPPALLSGKILSLREGPVGPENFFQNEKNSARKRGARRTGGEEIVQSHRYPLVFFSFQFPPGQYCDK
jgi:hypothetical protein